MICCLCGLFKFLHEGKCNNIQENKYGRIYTSTVPNKTIPFILNYAPLKSFKALNLGSFCLSLKNGQLGPSFGCHNVVITDCME